MDNKEQQQEHPMAEGEERQETVENGGEKKSRPNWLSRILGGEVLQSRAVVRQIPLIILLCFYAIMLVYNRYRVEDLMKTKTVLQDSITYLRETRIELQKRYQETIKISQIEELLDSTGVGIKAGPPYELSKERDKK